jgi:hypothetical protein
VADRHLASSVEGIVPCVVHAAPLISGLAFPVDATVSGIGPCARAISGPVPASSILCKPEQNKAAETHPLHFITETREFAIYGWLARREDCLALLFLLDNQPGMLILWIQQWAYRRYFSLFPPSRQHHYCSSIGIYLEQLS